MNTYVIGHKSPDTDSIVSAIALAVLLDATPARAGELNKETEYLLARFGFSVPEMIPGDEKKVFLVDHNEDSQIHENVKNGEISGVFDHHKLGGLSTSGPIKVDVWPVGATATLVTSLYQVSGVDLDREYASLLMGAIISDTLNLTSPTTTDQDRQAVVSLGKIAELDIAELAEQMFAAKSDISDISSAELVGKDFKVFSLSGKAVGVGVWETVLPQVVLDRKGELIELMKQKKAAESLDYIIFAVVDIAEGKATFIVPGESELDLAEAAFGGKVTDGLLEREDMVSRKKQVIPAIEKYLTAK